MVFSFCIQNEVYQYIDTISKKNFFKNLQKKHNIIKNLVGYKRIVKTKLSISLQTDN